jgi:hypothetical protein
MSVVATTPAMDVRAEAVVWRGSLTGRVDLEVRFGRPLAGRIWRALWG